MEKIKFVIQSTVPLMYFVRAGGDRGGGGGVGVSSLTRCI